MDRERTSIYVGICIYCGAKDALTDEHAIPFALTGNNVLQKASCTNCNKITTRFERSVLRNSMLAIRTVLDLPTRRPKSRPETLPMTFIRGNTSWEEQVPISDAIPAFVLPELGQPEVLSNMTHYSGLLPGAFEPKVHFPVDRVAEEHRNAILKKYSADAVDLPWEINHDDFRKLVAKIAMCEAIFIYGFKQFERIYVRDAILGNDRPAYWVGSDGSYDLHLRGGFDDSSHVFAVKRLKGQEEIWARIKLWNGSITPEYTVVVGRMRSGYARFLDAHDLIA